MLHSFYALGGYYLIDSETGGVCLIDRPAHFACLGLNNLPYPPGETPPPENEIAEAAAELNTLISEGALNSVNSDPPAAYSPALKAMCLNVCHDCNLACAYCFADGGSYSGGRGRMSAETARKSVDFLIANSGARKNLELDFFGGEPLLNFSVVKETVEYAKKAAALKGKRFRFTITTNAVTLTPEVSDWLNTEMYNVVISIDGRESVHNSVRKTRGGAGSYADAVKNARYFVSVRGDKFYYIRGTFTAANTDFTADCRALRELGFEQLSLEPAVLPDSHPLAIRTEHLPLIFAEYDRLAEYAYSARRRPETWFNFYHFMLDLDFAPCAFKRQLGCGAGCEYAAVTPSGEIYPCHQFAGMPEYKLGTLDNGFSGSPNAAYFKDNLPANKPSCRECWAKYYCGGGCAANNITYGGENGLYGTGCLLMKKRLECALALAVREREDLLTTDTNSF